MHRVLDQLQAKEGWLTDFRVQGGVLHASKAEEGFILLGIVFLKAETKITPAFKGIVVMEVTNDQGYGHCGV